MFVTVAETVAFLKRREAAAQAGLSALRDERRARLAHAAACLREPHGATKVWLFGSLAWGKTRADSDVDLAVEGLSAGEYWRSLAELSDLFGCNVDLVRIETADAGLRERILREGLPL